MSSDEQSPSPKKKSPKVKRKAVSTGPKTIDLVINAIKSNPDKKGTTVQSIKTYILENHPEVDPSHLRFRLKRAFEKGIENELLTRPKSSEEQGASLSGRYKLNKAKVEALNKPKKIIKKKKEEEAGEKKKTSKPKTKEASTTKKKTTTKSPKKSPKKTTKSTETKVKKTTKKKATDEGEKPKKKAKKSTEKTPEKKKKAKSPSAKKPKPKKVKE